MTDPKLVCSVCYKVPQGDDERIVVNGKVYCPAHFPRPPRLNEAQLANLPTKTNAVM